MGKFSINRMKGGLRTVASLLVFLGCSSPSLSQSPDAVVQGQAPAIKSQKFDDWYYRCTGSGDTAACEVAQVAQVAKDGKNVNVLTIATTPATSQGKSKPRLMLTALLPLNVFLPSGLAIKADGKPLAKLDYRNCNEAGCWAQQALDAKTTAALRKGSIAEGLVRLMNGQDVNIRFSLKGLSPALDELQSTAAK
ncbi:invasion associated locus B family protein [Rhizobium bangladeshense]|uniref:invasion associated locus B family protein n=1 Tax=Rhizobium bangladeshense TaxID=1138189 RepID=UPI0007E5A03F|nr:invasion associated locus B family protein [Rhizobium bangladeshense]